MASFDQIKFPTTEKVAVALSGGLDSTTLLYTLVRQYGATNVFAISFEYQQKQNHELTLAALTCKKLGINHQIVDMSFLGDIARPVSSNVRGSDIATPTIQEVLGEPQPSSYIPFRNLLFSSVLLSFAESNNCGAIALGLQVHDLYGYWDTSMEFVQAMQHICDMNRKHAIEIFTPFVEFSKVDELEIGIELGVDYSLTLTCYNPATNGDSCGICASCAERIGSFMHLGVIDPISYSRDIDWVCNRT